MPRISSTIGEGQEELPAAGAAQGRGGSCFPPGRRMADGCCSNTACAPLFLDDRRLPRHAAVRCAIWQAARLRTQRATGSPAGARRRPPAAAHSVRRYHGKRALYLLHLAKALGAHPSVAGTSWECLAGDPRKPVVVLAPGGDVALPGGLSIRLLPCIEPGAFPLGRLAPARNNLRSAGPVPAAAAEGAEVVLPPTPQYNASVVMVGSAAEQLMGSRSLYG